MRAKKLQLKFQTDLNNETTMNDNYKLLLEFYYGQGTLKYNCNNNVYKFDCSILHDLD